MIHFSKLAAVKNFFTIEMDTTRNKNSGCTGKTSHSKVRCHVELKIVLTLVRNKDCGNQSKMKRATGILCGLPSLQQYYLILVLSEFADHSPFTSNNMRSRERSIPATGTDESHR